MLAGDFGARFRARRESCKNEVGRVMSQEAAARVFNVSLSAVRGWERGRNLPDERSRLAIITIWPDFFVVTLM